MPKRRFTTIYNKNKQTSKLDDETINGILMPFDRKLREFLEENKINSFVDKIKVDFTKDEKTYEI